MTQVTVNGNTYSDDGTAEKDMNNGGHRTHFLPMLSDAVVDLAAKESSASISKNAAEWAAQTAINAPGTSATSTTSLTIGTGSKTLTIQTGKALVVGMTVKIANTASPTNWMLGDITAYDASSGNLTVAVSGTNGSGTADAWTVSLSGPMPTTSAALVLLSKTEVSAPVAAVDISGFSSAYDNYLILYENATFSGDTAFQLRFIKSGAAITTATYHTGYVFASGASVNGGSSSGGTGSQLLGSIAGVTAIHGGRVDVFTANTAGKSTAIATGGSNSTTANAFSSLSVFEATAAVLQGIRFYPNNGLFTITGGTFKLYGVAKA